MSDKQSVFDYECPKYAVQYHEAERVLRLEWRQLVRGVAFQMGADRLLESATTRSVRRLLIDHRAHPVLHPDDATWVMQQWLPRAARVGVTALGIVSGPVAVGRLSLEHLFHSVSKQPRRPLMSHGIYDDVAAALLALKRAPEGQPVTAR
jgi:hypothetical protein